MQIVVNNLYFVFIIFFLSCFGILYNRKNIIFSLIFIEIAFLSMNIYLILIGWLYKISTVKIFIIYLLTLTAIETAIGLVLFILYYKIYKSIDIQNFYKKL
jgi:NADH:ubiquinone oxidoreductase subunit K